jgi:hypothetical protein
LARRGKNEQALIRHDVTRNTQLDTVFTGLGKNQSVARKDNLAQLEGTRKLHLDCLLGLDENPTVWTGPLQCQLDKAVAARQEKVDHDARPRLGKSVRQQHVGEGVERANPMRRRALVEPVAENHRLADRPNTIRHIEAFPPRPTVVLNYNDQG